MGFCECTVKFALFVFNLACALLGLVILVVSVLAHIQGKSFKNLLDGQITTTTIILIAIGALVFLIAFFGCCGAIREDTCMLTTYGVILSALLLIQVAIGIMAFVYRSKFESGYRTIIEQTFDEKDKPDGMKLIDELQHQTHCCGTYGPDFWTQPKLPQSCCLDEQQICTREKAFKDGCEEKIGNIIKESFKILGAVALGIAAIELLCVIFAFCLSSSLKREELRPYA